MFAPFEGLRFDPNVVGDVASATSPPYDVIDSDLRAQLEAASPYNMAHLLLPTDEDSEYVQRASVFRSWIDSGALRRDSASYYIYELTYEDRAGITRTGSGVLGSLAVMAFGDRILPHEETMAKHTTDRLANLTAMEANLDVILALSSSPDLAQAIAPDGEPALSFTAADVEHRLYPITDPARIEAITAAASSGAVSIADGHHRYTTALRYQAAQSSSGGWDQILTLLAPAAGSGFTVNPYHRTFAQWRLDPQALHTAFEVSPASDVVPARPGDLVVVPHLGGALQLTPRPEAIGGLANSWQQASAAIAREVLYPLLEVNEADADYVADDTAAVDRARSGSGGGAILVAPVTEEAIAEASEAGVRFPQKTTFFVPKPRAGLVIRTFDS
ncbi:MAG: DUF1015 domain-containing protein [Acidimicrobiia bacterium]|nr:DUF1015 domain-containing protein [Acidimicrobiia bacterium]